MNKIVKRFLRGTILSVIALALPVAAATDAEYEDLKAQMATMQQQLEQMQEAMGRYEEKSASQTELADVQQGQLADLQTDVISAAEWKGPDTLIHMAGYADVGYVDPEGDDGSFVLGTFSPIFHYQYRDLVMLESELEFEIEDDGGTELNLEYTTIDLFLNDYTTLVAGKFLSPIGQFRQNLHPSWINKFTSAPPGFGHDGAAPISDMGVQFRGGFPIGGMRANYAAYVSNGPELNSETEDGVEFELEGIDGEGFGADRDGEKVFGGRFGLLPFPSLEIGLSAATGKASVTKVEVEETGEVIDISDEKDRDYDVFGFDYAWQYRSLGIRGEYVKSKVGSANSGVTASGSGEWSTWYAQAAYRFFPTKFEGVVRYSDFDAESDRQDQKQWGIGVNYLLANQIMAKLGYELNDGKDNSEADDNRWLLQLAYGF